MHIPNLNEALDLCVNFEASKAKLFNFEICIWLPEAS
jgi:hypothetical protein